MQSFWGPTHCYMPWLMVSVYTLLKREGVLCTRVAPLSSARGPLRGGPSTVYR